MAAKPHPMFPYSPNLTRWVPAYAASVSMALWMPLSEHSTGLWLLLRFDAYLSQFALAGALDEVVHGMDLT